MEDNIMSKSRYNPNNEQYQGQRDGNGFFVVTNPSHETQDRGKSTSKDSLLSAFEDFENSLEKDTKGKIKTEELKPFA
jgi:hypothetical protein